MAKRLKIEVSSGEVMYADLLPAKAPKTCAALEAHLPYREKTLSHGMYSGHALYLHTDIDFGEAECSRSYGVAPGDILYIPHVVDAQNAGNELVIMYGPAAIRNISGFAIANLCGQVRYEDWPMLYQLGIDINLYGERKVSISLVDC